jgi:hypothetical protein
MSRANNFEISCQAKPNLKIKRNGKPIMLEKLILKDGFNQSKPNSNSQIKQAVARPGTYSDLLLIC